MSTIKKVEDFAAACYDTNTLEELKTALVNGPDEDYLRTWELTELQWTEAIKIAIKEMEA